jgi:uncharacterized HhH-GPD family protein
MTELELRDIVPIEAFDHRWPDAVEHFDRGWEGVAQSTSGSFRIRHGLAMRIAYGRPRVRSVTWVNGAVAVEGVEADDHPTSHGLVSIIRTADKKMVRVPEDVPMDVRNLPIVDHRSEIDAPYSRNGLAVKLPQDDLERWAVFAISRMRLYGRLRPGPSSTERRSMGSRAASKPPQTTPTRQGLSSGRKRAIADALIAYAASGAEMVDPGSEITTNPQADALVRRDSFAFLLAVIFDQGIAYERAWAAPLELQQRLGHLDPERMVAEPEAVRAAVQQPPKLHRFIENVPAWVVLAATKVIDDYDGDAERIWSDEPTARELQQRLIAFVGIGQKKAAMAVEILERDLKVPIRDMEGSDIAYDIHVRRVFLRTGFADEDSMEHMVDVARTVHSERPGALDEPAWRVGKNWCHPRDPDCPNCVLREPCARLIDRTLRLA